MKVTIQTLDFKAQDKLANYVTEHVSKLGSLNDRIIEAQVFLKLEKSDTRENKMCELKLRIPGNDLFATRRSHAFESAVVDAVDAMRHQPEKWKDKHSSSMLRGSKSPLES